MPTGAELYADDLSEEELLSIGYDAAQEAVSEATHWADEEYVVARETSFIAEFCNSNGVQIGWEFEFQVYSV